MMFVRKMLIQKKLIKRGYVFIKLLFIFILVPLLEIYILIESGRIIGIGSTVTLIVLTGISGAWLARNQGLDMLRRIQSEVENNHMPTVSLLNGFLVLVGGVLLLTPGFFTDAVGFSFLIPATRQFWLATLKTWLEKKIQQGTIHIHRL